MAPKDLASQVGSLEFEFLGSELKLTVEQIHEIVKIRTLGTWAILALVDMHPEGDLGLESALALARTEMEDRIREVLGQENFERYQEFHGGFGEIIS
jgi:hypothetical protein